MLDRYMKSVFTVIAASLAILAAGTIVPKAGAQIGSGCGSILTPCYIATGLKPIEVRIER